MFVMDKQKMVQSYSHWQWVVPSPWTGLSQTKEESLKGCQKVSISSEGKENMIRNDSVGNCVRKEIKLHSGPEF